MKIIPPDWCADPASRVLICAERPGFDEAQTDDDDPYRNLVGASGQEFWARLWQTCHLTRDAFTVCNLVPTFSQEPPSPAEIAQHGWRLRAILQRVRPRIIIAVGAYAARHFLPQFADTPQEKFHGLAFAARYGRLRPRACVVVPCVHPAAALRQPDLYQTQLTHDLRAAGDVLRGSRSLHHAGPLQPARVGLAGFLQAGNTQIFGLDTEGTRRRPECLTLSDQPPQAALVLAKSPGLSHAKQAIEQARGVAIHYALSDWHLLARMGIDLHQARVHDTMLQAYLLGHPQGLKLLAYRLLGLEMQEYADLVQLLDDTTVRTHLKELYEKTKDRLDRAADAEKLQRRASRSRRAHDGRRRDDGHSAQADRMRRDRDGDAGRPARREAAGAADGPVAGDRGAGLTRRALASIKRIVEGAAAKSPRQRWEASKFAAASRLPRVATWASLPPAIGEPYAMTDAVAHKRAFDVQRAMLRERGLLRVYEIDRGILPFLARQQAIGMQLDTEELPRLTAKFEAERAEICAKLEAIAGHPVNPNAPEDVSIFLFDEQDVRKTKLGKSGYYTTQKKHLKAREKEHAAIPLIMEARHLTKLSGTYTKKLPGMLRRGRYHPDWKYTRTKTGRAAEEIILLIPKHSPYSKFVRNCFVAADGNVLLDVDLSQIELRVFASDSGDRVMMDAFRRGEDLHARTAYEILGAPRKKEDQDEDLHRHPSKTFNFSVIMGTTPYGLNDQMQARRLPGWSVDRCAEFLDEWFRVYKGGKQYVEARKAEARRFGYVTNMFGRRIPCDGIWSTDERIRAEYERQAHAGPVQSAAADIAKLWIARIWRKVIWPRIQEGRRYCEPYGWIHDAVMAECDRRIVKGVARECLALVPDVLKVPTLADAKSGPTWGKLSDLKL